MTIDSANHSKISNRTITTNRISNRTYDSVPARYLARFFFIFITTLRIGAETITTVWVAFGSYVLPSGCVRPTSRFTELSELAFILTRSVEQVNTHTFYLIRGIGNFAINALMSA